MVKMKVTVIKGAEENYLWQSPGKFRTDTRTTRWLAVVAYNIKTRR